MHGIPNWQLAGAVAVVHRVVVAVGKHVIAHEALTGGGKGIGVYESAEFGVVIAAL